MTTPHRALLTHLRPALAPIAAAISLSACTETVRPPPAGRVSVVYAGNVDGEIEPCG